MVLKMNSCRDCPKQKQEIPACAQRLKLSRCWLFNQIVTQGFDLLQDCYKSLQKDWNFATSQLVTLIKGLQME